MPIGAIHASRGGSRISAWMSDTALRSAGLARAADLLALHATDPVAAERGASTIWEDWWRRGTGDAPGREPWQPDAAIDWKPVPRIGNFEQWGVPALADYNGMVWYQRVVTLTAAQARGAATLAIGVVDDADRTWVNGIGVGGNSNAGRARVYPLPAGLLKAGRNVITVNDDDVYAFGGMTGPAETMMLTLADGSAVPIGDGWRYAIAKRVAGNAPRSPWDDINGAGTLYNGMIAPIGATALAGIAWYQGESDTGLPGYETRLAAMTRGWRQQFGAPAIPLAIAQARQLRHAADRTGRERLGGGPRGAAADGRARRACRCRGDDRSGRSARHPSGREARGGPTARARAASARLWRARAGRTGHRIGKPRPRWRRDAALHRRDRRAARTGRTRADRVRTLRGRSRQLPLCRRRRAGRPRDARRRRQAGRSCPLCLGGQPGGQSGRRRTAAGRAVRDRAALT
ncbi:sialate O-acetylesterase [Sphingomonas aurantiaca]|uniref:sialate O-acetylesterase n=1 Tax=Sphingomonas aurantiaca TaxID=185949 RepID=UPI002FE32619